MFKNIVIAVLLVFVAVLAGAVIQLENYHYASFMGMCSEFKADDPLQALKRHDCLHKQQTRTNPIWHLFYGMQGW
jgi:hypothetical protein